MTDLRDQLADFEAAARRQAPICHPDRPPWTRRRCRECITQALADYYASYDTVIVDRIIDGRHHGPIRPPEAAETVRRMAASGYSDGQIAYRLGRTARNVLRIRARHGIPAALPGGGANQHHLAHPEAPTRHWRAG
jgi:hypothetical protein